MIQTTTDADQTVRVSQGERRRTLPRVLTETTNQPLSAGSVQLAFGTAAGPVTDWISPEVEQVSGSSLQIDTLVSIDSVPKLGVYRVWLKIGEADETILVPTPGEIRII